MKYVLIDDYFSTPENVLAVHASLFSLLDIGSTDCIYSPTWPDNKPVSSYESILVHLIQALQEPAVFVAHSVGSLILEMCILKKKIPVDKIKYIIHCSPCFRNKKRTIKLLSALPSLHVQVPGVLNRSLVSDRFWYHSVWVRRNPTLSDLKKINNMMYELTHLANADTIPRKLYMYVNDEVVSFYAQAHFLAKQGFLIRIKNANCNRHRNIWENQLWFY